ncbi:MAG: 2Fe-2S iron-sulfur cluster-binding protein [Thermonemataceae bacterium]
MLSLQIKAIIPQTTDTNTYVLAPTNEAPVTYQAGQFLTLIFSREGSTVRRSYSLSSHPTFNTDLAITVKRVANGEISRWMLDHLQVGDIVKSLPPAGKFILRDLEQHSPQDIFFIAGGSGITPIFSMLQSLLHDPRGNRIILIYSSSNEQETIFWEPLQQWAAQYDFFHLIPIFSQPSTAWQSGAKRLNNYQIEQLVNKYSQHGLSKSQFYLCAPFSLMRLVRLTLGFMGVTPSQIFQEDYVIKPLEEATPVKQNTTPSQVKITYAGNVHHLEVPAHRTILQVALSQDLQLPYSCRGGRCSACNALCKKGEVQMVKNEVLTDRDLKEGWILTCTARPVSEVIEIDIPS